ncbi:MAG: CDP-alcohol phosphatidyltransferase family protein [Acidobacteriota bacterium]|jgi:CDP-diacylglycerol--glycerol-3-phosphate 3-phosphatidyltransferase|nr:CDP-alcohol phosphatidyltransferase family protein [Acidobacteriota bacterium]
MLTEVIGKGGKFLLDKIVGFLSSLHINPNILTFTGVLISFWAAFAFGYGRFVHAALVLIFAGLFDMLDGGVARISGRVSKFGAFYDSVIDRYSDVIVLQGLMVYYAREQMLGHVVLVGVVVMGAVLTSYARARAESLIPTCKVGFMERPERVVLLIIGGLSYGLPDVDLPVFGAFTVNFHGHMEAVLWVLAILGNWTVINRIHYTWLELPRPGQPTDGAERPQTDA